MKKIVAMIIVLTMIFLIASCATQTQEDEEQTQAVTTTTAAVATTTRAATTTAATTAVTTQEEIVSPFAEHMEINWLVGTYTSHLYEDGRWEQRELEEKFNVKLNMWNVQVDSNNMEQVQMMVAAGDVPDYGFYYRTGKYMYEQGLSRTIPLEMFMEYYPSYYKQFQAEPIGLHFNRVEDPDDPHYNEFLGIMTFTGLAHYSGHMPFWRLDWLEDMGYVLENLEPLISHAYPEWSNRVFFSTTHFSESDVRELFRAFTEDDPNNNGTDDTYGSPFSNTWYDMYVTYAMFGFDQNANHFYQDPVTSDFVPFYAYTPYRDMFSFVTDMIDLGYMRWIPGEEAYHLELFSIWGTGKTGYMNALGGSSVLGFNAQAPNRPPLNILEGPDPDARFVVTPVPGENGKFRPYWTFNWGTNYDYVIGHTVTDEKLIRLFHLLEYANFGENWLRYKWGIENVHYRWSGEPMNSPIIFTDEEDIPPMYRGLGTTQGFGQFGNINFVSDNKVYFSFDSFTVTHIDYWEKYNPGGYYHDSLWIRPDKLYSVSTMPHDLYDAFTEIRNETMSDINQVRNDFTAKIWDGQVADIRMEWEQYITQIYAAGLEQWVEIFNRDEIKTFEEYSEIQ